METGDSRADLPEPRRSSDVEPTHVPRVGPDDVRVGDADRNAAMSALNDHVSAGRLTIDEFGDRSAAASVAVTRADVARLFADLPAPHPPLLSPGYGGAAGGRPPMPWDGRRPSLFPAVAVALVMLAVVPLVATLAFAGLHVPGLLFLPLFFMVIGGFGRHGRGPRR